MSESTGNCYIAEDTFVQGKILNGRSVEIHGYVDGTISSDHVIIAPSGRAYGNVRAVQAEVYGEMQGDIRVKELIKIPDGGSVAGKLQYGAISLAAGGDLSADVRNVPPSLAGDLTVSVQRGRSVVITREDIVAIDPDDAPEDLKYEVKRIVNGMIALTSAPTQSVKEFTQAQVNSRNVMFVHDGTDGDSAAFSVTVYDASGASSGDPQTVSVLVKG